jgi:rhamnulose-1-phosphate aldolase
MIHLPPPFDRLVEDIALAGQQLTAMAAGEGAAGNISLFSAELACPLDAVEDVELPARAPSLAGGWMLITGGGRRLRGVGRRPGACVSALRIHDDGAHATLDARPGPRRLLR